jgi:ABC-type uncharacterized transport system involved in gliding motility auxiliary subunit
LTFKENHPAHQCDVRGGLFFSVAVWVGSLRLPTNQAFFQNLLNSHIFQNIKSAKNFEIQKIFHTFVHQKFDTRTRKGVEAGFRSVKGWDSLFFVLSADGCWLWR